MQRADSSPSYLGALRSLSGSAAAMRGPPGSARGTARATTPSLAVALNSDDDDESVCSDRSIVEEEVAPTDTNGGMRRESSEMILMPNSRNTSSEAIGSQRSGQAFLRPTNSAPWALSVLPSAGPLMVAAPLPPLPPPKKKQVPHILIVGNPQSGKSTLINAYRASVCLGSRWPSAPTGMCGLEGTTRVDGYPNNIERPQWVLVDTPGRVYDTSKSNTGDEDLLDLLIRGIPWKTRIGLSTHLDTIPPSPHHKCHHCIIVVNALNFVVDRGQWALLRLQSRYACSGNAGLAFLQLQHLVSSVRTLLNDTPPYVVVTHMDLVGGVDSAARGLLLQTLSKCISPLRTYFVACTEQPLLVPREESRSAALDGVKELRKLHQDLLKSLHWLAEQSEEDG